MTLHGSLGNKLDAEHGVISASAVRNVDFVFVRLDFDQSADSFLILHIWNQSIIFMIWNISAQTFCKWMLACLQNE